MEVKLKKDFGVVAKSCEFNMYELAQMEETRREVERILNNHKANDKKTEYISDDTLRMVNAILATIVAEDAPQKTSSFTEFLQMQDSVEACPLTVDENAEVLVKGGPGGYPTDYPICGESKNF
jgi:hypothetical protein